ncbi:MAG: DUF4416 family protein [Fibrobacter sp.]|nr:DUF4416 family protein [Fibrobacter sp.]
MAEPRPPFPVKYFIAVLFKDKADLIVACKQTEEIWGKIDIQGDDHLFDVTDYYHKEMGQPIYRRLIAFEKLYDPILLVTMKLRCNELELELSFKKGKRVVNLDAGYLDHNKVLLASAKEAGQKIYLDKGIYADLAGRYKAGKYQSFEWSFPDFKDGRYDKELCAFRKRYMEQMKLWRKNNPA